MPEIGEVARVVHYIRKNLVGKTLAKVVADRDENVFGKVGTSAEEIMKALTGKKVVDARQQGKYFWMVLSSPPHILMHFGMAGWFKFRNEETFYYKPSKEESPEWPPKYWKFRVETKEQPKCEAAFVDFRRFARIRLIDCAAEDIRKVKPLVDNGPDPVIDKDIVTEEWLGDKLGSKKIPVKALLLDQGNISGIGNWVGDEILYNAKIHPEQYSNTFSAAQIKQLHKSIHYICGFAVENLADSEKFPEEWLFKHRWGKGKKDAAKTLPNGLRFVHLTVGGRTSCVVPSVQKKTGPVAKDIEDEEIEDETDEADEENQEPGRGKKTVKSKKGDENAAQEEPPKKANISKKRATKQVVADQSQIEVSESKPGKPTAKSKDGDADDIKSAPPRGTNGTKKRSIEENEPKENGVLLNEAASEDANKTASKKRKAEAKVESGRADVKTKKLKAKTDKAEVNKNSERRRSGRTSGRVM